MSIIDDLKTAVDAYETDACRTEIVGYAIEPNQGKVLNTGETFRFSIKVYNDGELDMGAVKVRANGTQYADVTLNNNPWGSSVVSTVANNISAGQNVTFTGFRGKAKKDTGGKTVDIVTARIDLWDASLNHILFNHTGAAVVAEGKLPLVIAQN
jgi:hypothetical protein